MRPRPILYRIELDSDTHFPVITQRNTDVMWVDQSEGLIGDRLMVKSIEPIFFLSSRSRENRLTPKSPQNIDSGAGRRWNLSSGSSSGYTNTVTTHFPLFDDTLYIESTLFLF